MFFSVLRPPDLYRAGDIMETGCSSFETRESNKQANCDENEVKSVDKVKAISCNKNLVESENLFCSC